MVTATQRARMLRGDSIEPSGLDYVGEPGAIYENMNMGQTLAPAPAPAPASPSVAAAVALYFLKPKFVMQGEDDDVSINWKVLLLVAAAAGALGFLAKMFFF